MGSGSSQRPLYASPQCSGWVFVLQNLVRHCPLSVPPLWCVAFKGLLPRPLGPKMALMPTIHPTAIVDHRAELADDVEVGAFTTIGPGVSIGPGTVLFSHNVIQGPTVI